MRVSVHSRRDFLRAVGFSTSALALSGCAGPSRQVAGPPPGDPPNILWVTCEDTSPYLGCYGDPDAITPNIDKLAAESVLYTKAFATAPVCAPSRSCLVTGVHAISLGTQHLRSQVELPNEIKCFPQFLRLAGYYCTNNSKKDYNFIDEDVWDESSRQAHWRNRKAGRPFFSVFNLTSTHQGQINGSDEEFFDKYTSNLEPHERHDPGKLTLPPYYPDTPVVRKIWARYYNLITFMDKQVGELLGQLEADGLADSTIVFFFSDHGMGLPRFKRTLYDSGIRVPLIVRFARKYQSLAPAEAGRTSDGMVSFVDFAPTVLTLAGLPVPAYMQGKAFAGSGGGIGRQHIFAAASRVDEAYEFSRCVRDERYKYIRNYLPHLPYIQPSEFPDRAEIMKELRRAAAEDELSTVQSALWSPVKPIEELYDTVVDPHEIDNLADSPRHGRILARLRDVLRRRMLRIHDTGFLPEAEMHIRSEGSTPYETARDTRRYPQQRIALAAELVGRGPEDIPKMIGLLGDTDSAVRYWAVIALTALGREAESTAETLSAMLKDPAPNVRLAAAGALCRMDVCEDALPALARSLEDEREETVLYAARELQSIGEKACPLVERMKAARARYLKANGTPINRNHAMFIDWALMNAIENCHE